MLTQVELRAPGGGTPIIFAMSIPSSATKYLITDIQGLGPVKADVASTNYASFDGAVIDNLRVGARNIVIKANYVPDFTASETVQKLRRALYLLANPGNTVELTFINDDFNNVTITGVIEDNAPSIFSKTTDVQISIICEDPYFKGPTQTVNEIAGAGLNVVNPGDVPVGFLLTKTITSEITGVALVSGAPDAINMAFNIDPAVVTTGRTMLISTVQKAKYAKFQAETTPSPLAEINLLPYLTAAGFPRLRASGTTNILLVQGGVIGGFALTFTPKYKGL